MKITRLRTHAVNLPLDPPFGVGYAMMNSIGCVLVFLETDQGLVGEGLVSSNNAVRMNLIDGMVKSLAPLVEGLDPTLSGQFGVKAKLDLRGLGSMGIEVMAVAGIEEALLDLRAKIAGMNVARLLGACRTSIPCYQSDFLWVSLSIDELQRNASDILARGFKAMKMRLNGDLKTDVPRIKAIREVIGPDVQLLADANQKMSVPQALRFGRAIEEFNLGWLEEPVAADDHHGEAQVAAALDTPIAAGESVFGAKGIYEMLEAGGCDIPMPDLQRMGGPSEFLKAGAAAEFFGKPVSSHLYSEMSLPLLCTLPNANILECMPWTSPAYEQRIELDKDGRALLPDQPGWGFDFSKEAMKRFAL